MRRLASVAFLAALGAFAACSDSTAEDVQESKGDPSDPATPPGDDPILLPDGTIVLPDGAVIPPDGGGDAAADAEADASTDAGVDAADAAPPITFDDYDINHVLVTGASDSTANGAGTALTTTQPFGNLKFNTGIFTASGRVGNPNACDGSRGCLTHTMPTSFVELKEGDKYFNYGVESSASGFANQATAFVNAWKARVGLPAGNHNILVSNQGRSGFAYDCLRKGSCDEMPGWGYIPPFEQGTEDMRRAKALADAQNKTYVVRAVNVIHGQSEHDDNENSFRSYVYRYGLPKVAANLVGNYANALIEWQQNYEADARAITGQAEPVPMFVSQFGSYNLAYRSYVPERQLEAHERAPGKVIVVTPNYPFDQSGDCNHYVRHEQRRLGAYFAKAYQRVVVEKKVWEPVRPESIRREGNVLYVKFIVPVPPLEPDTTRVAPVANLGFTFTDTPAVTNGVQNLKVNDVAASTTTITSVEVLKDIDTVKITLSKVPPAGSRLRYALSFAYNPGSTNGQLCPGPETGSRGNLRDSDTTRGYYQDAAGESYELFNWMVQFDKAVP